MIGYCNLGIDPISYHHGHSIHHWLSELWTQSRQQIVTQVTGVKISCCRRFALTLLTFIVDIAFALSLGGLLGMHARMVWLNVTTIEMFEKQRVTQWPFDRGPKRNFQQVFGTR